MSEVVHSEVQCSVIAADGETFLGQLPLTASIHNSNGLITAVTYEWEERGRKGERSLGVLCGLY